MGTSQPAGRRDLLDVRAAGEYIGRNEAFMRRLVARREVVFYKPGRALRFDPRDLDAYLDRCRVEPWSW